MDDNESADVSAGYMAEREARVRASQAQEMLDWITGKGAAVALPVKPQSEAQTQPIDPFPVNRKAPKEQSTAGTIMRNIGEVPGAVVGGVESAIQHSMGWAIDPLANWLNEHVADLSYTRDQPETATGKVTKSISEFLTGFLPVMKGMKALGLTEKLGTKVAPLVGSAVADFMVKDPHEGRLANVWQDLGLPSNVLTDYLAAEQDDTAIEGRLKSAAESVLTGGALEGVMLGARAVRGMKQIEKAKGDERTLLKQKYGEMPEQKLLEIVGDPSRPMVVTAIKQPPAAVGKLAKAQQQVATTTADDLVGGRGVIDAGEMKLYVNFARIDKPDDVKAVIAEMAERHKGSIDESRRGVISQKETAALADKLGMSVPDLLARRKGQPLNAEEALAARQLWAASGDKLLQAAKDASAPNAGPLEQFAFRRMMATHAAIQNEVIGARTETARALASWRIPAGGGIEKARAIEQVLEASGGSGTSQELARRLAILAEQGDPRALAKFAEKGWGARSFDAVREVWINGLLSSPATHAVNVTSNMAVAFQQMLERGVAQRIGQLRGTDGGIAPGEAAAMAYGMVSAIKDAFNLSWKALKTGESGWALNKVELPQTRAISADALNMASETGLGRTVDYIGHAFSVPSRLLGAEDEFFKTIGYRMELHAQALRMATTEGKRGPELAARMRDIVLDPPEHIRIAATDAALYSTFSNKAGSVGQAFMNLREKVPALSFVLPFIRTPANIMHYTFERTPIAPLMQSWKDDVAAGGARADLALARMATGSSIMAAALDWADSGRISGRGPQDKGEREAMTRQGWQPYSVKVGDKWYSYNRIDPFGAMLGFAADSAEAIRNGEINEDDVDEWQEVLSMGIAAVSQVVINKQYLRGLSEVFALMSDPTRKGESYVSNLFASFLPFTSLQRGIERMSDPVVRETSSPWEAAQARLMGLSETLPPRRTVWGEEIRDESGLGKAYDFFSPVQVRTVKPEPIDAEIMRLAPLAAMDNVEGSTLGRIGKRTSFQGVQVNFKEWPEAYDEYVRLAGNAMKHPAFGLGAKDFLNQVVQGKHQLSKVYEMRSDAMKILFINNVVQQYRTLAQTELLRDPRFADFAMNVKLLQAQKMQQRMPVLQ